MPGPNTSATGGPLLPSETGPLAGQPLLNVLHDWIAGICGIADGSLVRPSRQSEPPALPDPGVTWLSFAVVGRTPDAFPWLQHDPAGGRDLFQRNEVLDINVSFYDVGVLAGGADALSDLLRDGAYVPQNREPLIAQGMDLVDVGPPVPVPVLVKLKWQYRVDQLVRVRRLIQRTYPVLDFATATFVIRTDDGLASSSPQLDFSKPSQSIEGVALGLG